MYTNTIPGKQMAAWLAAALIPVTLQLCTDGSWVMVSVAVVICSFAVFIVGKWGKTPDSVVVAAGEIILTIVVLSKLMRQSAMCWPGDNDPAVPLILMGLAVWSVQKGAAAAARVGCVLFWLVMILYTLVMGAAAGTVKIEWLRAVMGEWPWKTGILLLIPSASMVLCKAGRKLQPRLLLPGVMLIIGVCIVTGVLSRERVNDLVDPFYTMSQSLRIFGVAQRFDAVLSAGMTVGWFALMCVLLCIGSAWTEKIHPKLGKHGAWLVAIVASAGMLCNLHIDWWLLLVLSTIFWVVFPLITQGLVRLKKM